MICDCHVNIWTDEDVRPSFAAQLARVRPGGVGLKADAESVYAAMAPVDRAIVFTLRYGDTVGVEGEDSTTAAAVARYPDKLVGFAYLDPRRPDCLGRLRHSVETLGLKGVKYGPIYNGVPLDDPRLAPVYRYCIDQDLPLTLHMGTTYTRLHAADLGRPLHVEALALRHPELKIVMAHMAHPWYEECAIVVRKQPNVYAEISAIYYRRWQFYNVMMAVQEYRVADKIFFGSDFPFSTPAEALQMTRAVNDLTAGTQLPRVADETIETVIHADPFAHWWRSDPLAGGRTPSAPS